MNARTLAALAASLCVLAGCSSDPSSNSGDGDSVLPDGDDGGGITVDSGPDGGSTSNDGGRDATVDSGSPRVPAVRFVGRVDTSDGKGTRFQWPGVSLHAKFTGTSVSMDLQDSYETELAVFVDGTERPKVVASKGRKTYELASGLSAGTHELLVWRRSDPYVGLSEFYGLTFGDGGALLAPPDPLPRRIEIIGDSITVGYGNEGSNCTFSSSTENNYLAYGSVAARAVGAELSTVAWSGIGMYRNYGAVNASPDAMPSKYDDALPESHIKWDFSKFTPDLVVIHLGTNDSSTHGDPGQPFIDAYVAFVRHLRTKYPQAQIICINATNDVTDGIAQVVSTFHSEGDTKIEAFSLKGENWSGCDGHPNVAGDAAMGASLAGEIKRVMKW